MKALLFNRKVIITTLILTSLFILVNFYMARWEVSQETTELKNIQLFTSSGIIGGFFINLMEKINPDDDNTLSMSYSPYWRMLNGLFMILAVLLIFSDKKREKGLEKTVVRFGFCCAGLAVFISLFIRAMIQGSIAGQNIVEVYDLETTALTLFSGAIALYITLSIYYDGGNAVTEAKLSGTFDGLIGGALLGFSLIFGFVYTILVALWLIAIIVIPFATIIAITYYGYKGIIFVGKTRFKNQPNRAGE